MGDKKGGKTTRQLFHKENQEALKQIQQVLKIPLKFVHVIRNPYDNIATMLLRAVNKRNEADTGEKVIKSVISITLFNIISNILTQSLTAFIHASISEFCRKTSR